MELDQFGIMLKHQWFYRFSKRRKEEGESRNRRFYEATSLWGGECMKVVEGN